MTVKAAGSNVSSSRSIPLETVMTSDTKTRQGWVLTLGYLARDAPGKPLSGEIPILDAEDTDSEPGEKAESSCACEDGFLQKGKQ